MRNPRRTLASLVGVTLGVGLCSATLFFIDASGATMTQRALAPLVLDMQWVVTSPTGGGLTLEQVLRAPETLQQGEKAKMILVIRNNGSDPAHEVVVRDEPPNPLIYVPGTTRVNGKATPDHRGGFPLSRGEAGSGLNVGTIAGQTTITVTYSVRASRAVILVDSLTLNGTISSREVFEPAPANPPPQLSLRDLRSRIEAIPGVAAADELSLVDLPPGFLRSPQARTREITRVFSFSRDYPEHYPSIRIVSGALERDSTLLSAEASRLLAVGPGEQVTLRLPKRRRPLPLTVSGIADLAQATPLFYSRRSDKFEDFLYVPHALIVHPATFRSQILPSLRAARAERGRVIRTFPLHEVDVLIDRTRLRSDPASALDQTKAIARAVEQVAASQGYLIDNVSNVLQVAKEDARVGKRMFIFLGLPGGLLAACLASYAGGLLATTQRREHATLRVRGAHRTHLRQLLLYRTLFIASVGSLLGSGIGLLSALLLLTPGVLFEASGGSLLASAAIATGMGALATALALYVPGHNALGRDVHGERAELATASAPVWRRMPVDVVMLGIAGVAQLLAYRAGAFDPPVTSVSSGEAVVFPLRLLVAPIATWLAGTLLSARLFAAIASRLRLRRQPQLRQLVRGILIRSLHRRAWTAAGGVLMTSLVVGLGVSLALFSATYGSAKAEDTRFVVGSDVRLTPSALSSRSYPRGLTSKLEVAGVSAVTPVVAKPENAVLIGSNNQDRADLTAIDPKGFGRVAALSNSFFDSMPAASAMTALDSDPKGVLVEAEIADHLGIERGDRVRVLLARGTKRQILREFDVIDLFTHMPAFPQQTSLVVNLTRYERATGLKRVDFFLARTRDDSLATLRRALAALRAGPGSKGRFDIETTMSALNKDQSSLTALNIDGLLGLNRFFTLLMAAASIAMFVLGLMLHRRREYVVLLAHGLQSWKVQALLFGEAAIVALWGVVGGIVVGMSVAILLVHILRPLFILDPGVTTSTGDIFTLPVSVMLTTLVVTVLATVLLRRLKPTEVLREG